jgi:hypothetical protein
VQRALPAVLSGLVAGCLPAPEHRCAGDTDCAGGVCVSPPSACAFADGTCASGLRFGEGAGALASTCVAGAIDAGAIDAAIDARPVDGPPAADEDRDGVGDVADNCPHVANPQQENFGETNAGAPADGVGDACDPEPTIAGNQLALFDGFNGALVGWSTSGSVTPSGGRVRIGANATLTSNAIHPRHVQLVIGARALGTVEQVGVTVAAAVQLTGVGASAAQVPNATPRLRLAYGASNLGDVVSTSINGSQVFRLALTTTRSLWTGEVEVLGGQPIRLQRPVMQSLANGRIAIAGGGGAAFELEHVVVISLADP